MQEVKNQSISQAGAGDEAFQEKKLGRKSPPMCWLPRQGQQLGAETPWPSETGCVLGK